MPTTGRLAEIASTLPEVLARFDWEASGALCREAIARIDAAGAVDDPAAVKTILAALRRKRQFDSMEQLANVCLMAGLRTAGIRRQYAQALIEQGRFAAAEFVLQSSLDEIFNPRLRRR